MLSTREFLFGLSGAFFLLGALSFFVDYVPEGYENLMFGLLSLIGAVLLIVGLLIKGPVNPKGVRRCAYVVIAGGIIILLASALQEWDVAQLQILVTCGASAAAMYILSVKLMDRISE